jgi:MFS family permease
MNRRELGESVPTHPVAATVTNHTPTPRRNPTLAGFLALGLFWGAWAAVLPSVQEATGVSKGALGVAMLFVTVGSLPAMLFVAGPLVDRFGVRAVALTCAAFACATTLPGLATTLPVLIVTLALTGAASGTLDVAINASAARIEADSGKRLMPLAHGLYSVGILLGAVGAGLARGAGSSREPILLVIAALIGLTALWTGRQRGPISHVETRGLRFGRALVWIGVVGAAAFVVEGGMESWSALFLEQRLHAEPSVSGLGPGVFGASMAAGRFFGQAAHRVSDRVLLAGGSAVSAVGCAIAATAPNAPVALVGFAIGGAGISLNAPIVFGAAGRKAATAVATVTTVGYVGLLVGPPLVGGIAQALDLRASFLALAVIAAAVAVGATRLRLD